jgi:predicted nucleic acid-binding protein
MRAVPDTNVLPSGIVFGEPLGEIMALAAARQLQLILSPPLITELRRVQHGNLRAVTMHSTWRKL